MKAVAFWIFLCVWLPALAAAQMAVPGRDDPKMQEAVELWLSGEDLPALKALSKRAQEGNVAAQMLLAGIDDRGYLHRHVTQNIPRKERIALMRVPRGISGFSWQREAGKVWEPAAVLERWRAGSAVMTTTDEAAHLNDMRILLAAGEAGAAMELLFTRLNYLGVQGVMAFVRAIGDDLPIEAFPTVLQILRGIAGQDPGSVEEHKAWIVSAFGRHREEDLRAIVVAWRAARLNYEGSFEQTERDYAALNAPVSHWHVLERFCGYECRAVKRACVISGAAILALEPGSRLGSPRASVISDETYRQSRRAMGDLIRYAGQVDLDAVSKQDSLPYHRRACFAVEMADTARALAAQ